jgi:hypothetical protein
MIRYSKLTAVAAAALLSAPAFAAMTTDANLELDTTFRSKITPGEIVPGLPSTQGARQGGLAQDGRVEFNVAGKAGDANGFVAGRGTLLIKKDGTTATDDMWGQIGTGIVDLKLGRFEATDMFPPGKDVYVEDGANAAGGYRNALRGRRGNSDFHGALTINPGGGVSVELGFIEHKRVFDLSAAAATNTQSGNAAPEAKGIRPVVSFAAGPVTVKVALESGKVGGGGITDGAGTTVKGAKFNGFAATVGGAFEGVGFNVNLGTGKIKKTDLTPEIKATSFGANATFGPAGVGLIMDTAKVLDAAGDIKAKDMVVYAAYSIPLFGTGATLTPAVSHQTGKITGQGLTDKYKSATGVRVRMNYTF